MNEIDVSKCEFYCEKYDGCYCFNSSKEVYAVNPNEHNSCEANKDCYYRQLQQAKKTIASQKGLITVGGKTQTELLAKVDALEKEKEFWCNKSVRFEEFVDKLVEEKDKLKAENEELQDSLGLANKYKAILDEIVEHIKTCNNTMYCKDCKFFENCQYRNGWGWREIILQKIKQAKEGENK